MSMKLISKRYLETDVVLHYANLDLSFRKLALARSLSSDGRYKVVCEAYRRAAKDGLMKTVPTLYRGRFVDMYRYVGPQSKENQKVNK